MPTLKKWLVMSLLTATSLVATAAGIRTVTVDAEGVGPSREKAITSALSEAVARVNGLALDARDVSRVSAQVQNTTKGEKGSQTSKTQAELKEDVDRQIMTKTQGAVKSYQVIDVSCADGECRAKLQVDINKFDLDKASERVRIAVLPFRVSGADGQKFQGQLNQGLVTYLTNTRHFAVLDRDFQGERLGELEGLMRDDVRSEERARIGNSLGTDYIVTGKIEDLQESVTTKKVPYTNDVVQQHHVSVVVNWRVIDASSGQVLAANTAERDLTFNEGGNKLGQAGREIGSGIAETLTDIIYPVMVLSYQKDRNTVLLGQGGSTLKVGTPYRLVKYGALVEDPYTGEKTAREEIDVGVVEITRVTPKLAYGKVKESNVNLEGAAPREYILRFDPTIVRAQQKKAAPKTMTPAW